MDEDDIDIQTRRRSHLGDEPIYCAAPPPSNPDDIIYYASDEELDEPAKVAKRLKYEAQALRYLEGKPMRILSATLRGPFDKASGWENPWLPKQPATKEPVLEPSQPPTKPLPAIKQRFLRRSQRLVQQDGTTPGTGNSMRYHFPSPGSNRQSTSPLGTNKRIQIKAWAKEVSLGTLDRDPFWAPDQVLHEETTQPDRKRPVGEDWLKGKQSKRKRLDSSQTPAAASTPMPMPRAQASTRSRSVPTNIGHVKPPVPPSMAASRSFELATPPSTINQNGPEITSARVDEISTGHGKVLSQDELSNASGPTTSDSIAQETGIIVGDPHDQPLPADGPECGQTSDLETRSSSKQAPRDAMNQDQQSQEETGLESYLDQSFHYRARPPKTTPVPDPSLPIEATCPQLTQTGTPESPSHADAVTVAAPEVQKQLEDIISKNQQIDGSDIRMSQHSEIISHAVPGGAELPERQGMLVENTDPMSVELDSASTTSETTSSLSTGDEVEETKEPDPAQDDSHMPPTVVEIKPSRDSTSPINQTTAEAHLVRSEPLVEEGSALVDDPVDADRKEPLGVSEWPTTHHAFNIPTVPIPEPHDAIQENCENIAQDESDSESNSIIIPLSQLEWGITEAIGGTPKKPKVVAENEIKSPDDNPAQATLLDFPEIDTQRSPWVPDLPPGADLTIDYIKSEPIDDPLYYCYPYQCSLLTSQINSGETSRIGPSQQSPWAGELLEPKRSSDGEHCSTAPVETIPANTSLAAAALGEHQSPWDMGNTSIPSFPNYPLISSPLAAYDETSLHPPSQSPMLVVEPEQRSSGYGCNSPVTPPRAPASYARTPELEKSIMPFAVFNTPSPKRRARQLSGRYSITGHMRGILSSAKHSNPWSSGRSSRRVSFAPLPTEDDANFLSASAPNVTRVASPPPQTIVDAKDEDVDGRYQNHFDAVKRRATGEDVQLRLQPQILPSFSQQKPSSPAFNAMAAAFREADAYMTEGRGDLARDIEESTDQEMDDVEQSPWRKESQGVDDVADVMNNLDDFIGAFDVEAELEKESREPIRSSHNWGILG